MVDGRIRVPAISQPSTAPAERSGTTPAHSQSLNVLRIDRGSADTA